MKSAVFDENVFTLMSFQLHYRVFSDALLITSNYTNVKFYHRTKNNIIIDEGNV